MPRPLSHNGRGGNPPKDVCDLINEDPIKHFIAAHLPGIDGVTAIAKEFVERLPPCFKALWFNGKKVAKEKAGLYKGHQCMSDTFLEAGIALAKSFQVFEVQGKMCCCDAEGKPWTSIYEFGCACIETALADPFTKMDTSCNVDVGKGNRFKKIHWDEIKRDVKKMTGKQNIILFNWGSGGGR